VAAAVVRSIRGGGEKLNGRASKVVLASLAIPLLVAFASAPAAAQPKDRDRPSTTTPTTTNNNSTRTNRNTGPGRTGRQPTNPAGKSRTSPLPSPQPYEFSTLRLGAKGEVFGVSKGEGMSFGVDLGGVALEMVKINEGSFYMGTPEAEVQQVLLEYQKHCNDPTCRKEAEGQVNAGRPQHLVTVPATFFIGKFEVTQAQWLAVAQLPKVRRDLPHKPSKFPGADRPVERVTWDEAVEFCARLSRKTGRTYRLPSEAEWEYACRAGMITQFAFGDTIIPDFINFDGRYPYGASRSGMFSSSTRPVGWGRGGIANAFGLYDTHGNVAEWCQDTWNAGYAKAPDDARAVAGGEKGYRVVRGGSWRDQAARCRSAAREKRLTTARLDTVGFRVVVS
jgi:formylglycine-generating enzyme required for sulfatase activity